MHYKDLTGKRFGRWVVLKFAYTKNNKSYWLCKCDCGTTKEVAGYSLSSGGSLSCGCYNTEIVIQRSKTHGMSNSKLYYIYRSMLNRCFSPKVKEYKYYGARGITVCNEWKNDFMSFYKWAMANGYEEGLTIERIDINGNYCPKNCKWIPKKQQNRNKSSNHFVTYQGKTFCLAEWEEKTGIKQPTIRRRLRYGWSVERALTTPVYKKES